MFQLYFDMPVILCRISLYSLFKLFKRKQTIFEVMGMVLLHESCMQSLID